VGVAARPVQALLMVPCCQQQQLQQQHLALQELLLLPPLPQDYVDWHLLLLLQALVCCLQEPFKLIQECCCSQLLQAG
jgi:hypothetical protein